MYFDELYNALFIVMTLVFAKIASSIDRYVVDGLVHFAARVTLRGSRVARLNDDRVFDGAVSGVANSALGLGVVVRASQTGRIRTYVAVLMVALAIGLAGAILLVLSTSRH